MALYFLYMKTFGRGNGSSAVSAAAYRSGERLRDERTGKTHDHADRLDVRHKEIVLPDKLADADMSWALARPSLWNAVEAAESRKNARVAREFLVALPAELNAEQHVGLVRRFARDLANRHQFAIDVAIHEPRTDPRNHHAHLLATTREIHTSGFGLRTGLEISDSDRRERGLEPFYMEVISTRERWAVLTNQALEAANLRVRVDHRSLEAQGIDREPVPRLPRAVYELQKRGQYSEMAERIQGDYLERAASRSQKSATESSEQVRTGPANLDEVRRQAREAWLQLREGKQREASAAHAPTHGFDDDLTR